MEENLKRRSVKSELIMERSRRLFPGGVNSPVRSFQAVGGTPVVFSHGLGKWLTDVDGNRYVDFCSSWGPLILGYSHPRVVEAIQKQAEKGMTFGAPAEPELRLAEKIREWVPGMEMMRFVNSGTEATMSALRLARAATGRKKFIKFEGCYHGHGDAFLVKAGSGLATFGAPSSAGVPQGAVEDTLIAIYNDRESVEELFEKYGNEIACLIVEPVAANMGLVTPLDGFMEFLRDITRKYGSLLIYDEVMTGFRLARGGAAEVQDIEPDLRVFGKIVGGGLPAAVYGGSASLMSSVAPLGPSYQAGTLSGNPLAMAAGYATLQEMENCDVFATLEKNGSLLDNCVLEKLGAQVAQGKVCYVRCGSFFSFFFGTNHPPRNFTEVAATDMKTFSRVYHAWLDAGIYLGPGGYEVGFLSVCHEESDLEALVSVVAKVLQ